MPPSDNPRSFDPVIGQDFPDQDLWMAGVQSVQLEDLERYPNYTELLALLVHHKNVLQRRRVTNICRAGRSHFNGEGVLHIAPEDFTREGLLALLGVTDDQSAPPAAPASADADTTVRGITHPLDSADIRPVRSRLLGFLRALPLPRSTANAVARGLNDTAKAQLDDEIDAQRGYREFIAKWFVERRFPGQNYTVRSTDGWNATRFNIFDGDGNYSGYSLAVSALPPFQVKYIRAEQIRGTWRTKIIFDVPFSALQKHFGGETETQEPELAT